ncbi:type I-E CRISPR-associated protein Cse2/CasB [Roseateles sp. SL47]|uniref:type I-E CRISPR-associated protein Cse2/CasB n=1 Tax=Roseateles sp. SL47 TaxID=2995138 RepID=UPI002271E507|nr:type I-E CRISPR-associated protein Cse2/CasB [Roseateles sp. SL47]WAC73098.1 type I-E CRISPR-associated protein Cse2/CasB [Roseateles sp. SL47]
MSRKLTEDTPVGKALIDWWKHLDDDKGGRAQLRRASSVFEALMCPAFQRLQSRLVAISPEMFSKGHQLDRLAMACALMAHVKVTSELTLPKAMSARPKGAERNPVSELRFKRLLESPDDEALFSGLRRALPLIEQKVDLLSLASAVLYWGNDVKRAWAYDYDWL